MYEGFSIGQVLDCTQQLTITDIEHLPAPGLDYQNRVVRICVPSGLVPQPFLELQKPDL